MKNSKFWIWFIPLFVILCIGIYINLSRNSQNNNNNITDSVKIKEEYIKDNDKYYNVELSDTNVYKYIDTNTLNDIFNNKDGLLFIGDKTSNMARKDITVLNDVVSSTSILQVYYVDVNDLNDDLKNIINEKTDNVEISGGTLIAVQGGKVLNIFNPKYTINSTELSDSEKLLLYNDYKDIINNFVEECNENC